MGKWGDGVGNWYVSDVAAGVMGICAVLGVAASSALGHPVAPELGMIASAAVGFYFGHANGRKVASKEPPQQPTIRRRVNDDAA